MVVVIVPCCCLLVQPAVPEPVQMTNALHSYRVSIFYGTRPEILKLAPVIREYQRRSMFSLTVVDVGQHRELLKGFEETLDIVADR